MTVTSRATFENVEKRLSHWSDFTLSALLLTAGLALIVLALWPEHRLLKAFIAAYVYLP